MLDIHCCMNKVTVNLLRQIRNEGYQCPVTFEHSLAGVTNSLPDSISK